MVKRWRPGQKTGDVVPAEEAERRALSALDKSVPRPANAVADVIWPNHQMKPQGAGGAASRVLKRLEGQGKAAWVVCPGNWGWIRT